MTTHTGDPAKQKRLVYNASFIAMLLIVISLVLCTLVVQAAQQTITVNAKQIPNIDIVLTRSRTNVDLTNFENDILDKLEEKGINRNKVKISAIAQEEVDLQSSFDWEKDVSSSIGSISFGNDGSNVNMLGNRTNAGKNAIYIIPETEQDNELVFNYNINFGDSFNAAGILIGITKEDNMLKGYMISFNNSSGANWKAAAGGANGALWEFKYVLNANNSGFEYRQLKRALNINTSGQLDVKATSTEITISGGGLSAPVVYPIDNYYGSGFGFFSSHYSHNCDQIGKFALTGIALKTTTVKEFNEVLKSPEWRDGTNRFIVNVSDISSDELNNDRSLSEIVTRMMNDDVHYIGWANSVNKNEMQNLLDKNDSKGIITDNTNYAQAIEDTAEYIKSLLDDIDDSNYVLIDEPVELTVVPSELRENTTSVVYPNGSWKVEHDYNYFENSNGQYEKTNQYTDAIISEFTKVGKYSITYQDGDVIQEIYAHRRPVASFNMKINGNKVELTSTSYDLDKQSVNNGIQEEEWSYKKIDDTDWTQGKLTNIDNDDIYIVKLRVKDYQNTWSEAETKYITSNSVNPVASFEVVKNPISIYNKLQIVDSSYDPAGIALTQYNWRVKDKTGNEVYTGTQPLLDYKAYGIGEYTIVLTVTNANGKTSEEFSKKIEITDDITPPEFEANPITAETINEKINVNLKFTDDESGFDYYKYSITQNDEVVTSWSENIYKQLDTIELTNTDKEQYIHIIAVDRAGNESSERIIGPYKINDIGFDLEIHMTDESDNSINLGNAEFSLIHPKEDTPDERIILYGTTDGDGVCHINGKAYGDGKFEYIVYETKAPAGYQEVGLSSLKITFKNGKITFAENLYNSEMELVEYTENKVVLNIGSKKQDKDTFNLKLEVEDKNDSSKKVSDATYKIVAEAASGEKIGVTDTTDKNGEINIKNQLSGNGQVVIYLQQISANGYVVDNEEKMVVLQRDKDTGNIEFVRWKSSNYINVNIDNNTVEIKLKAEPKETQNLFNIQICDMQDKDVLLKGVEIQVEEDATGRVMTGRTDKDGILSLDMTAPGLGKFVYNIRFLNLPSEYEIYSNDIKVEIEYDGSGNITSAREITTYTLETNFKKEETEKTMDNVAFTRIGLNRSSDYEQYNLKIIKQDKLNPDKKLSNVEYEITIKDNNGQIERTTQKTTDSWGEIVVDLPSKDSVIIEMVETVAKKGYILDSNVKTITLEKNSSNEMEIIGTQNITATRDNKNITAIDTNLQKVDNTGSKANISFDFTKKDKDGNLLGNVCLNVKELVTNTEYNNVYTDAFGKATIKNFNVPDEGKYIFEIEEANTVPGYSLPSTKIVLEITYEIINGEMVSSAQIIKKGETYIEEKHYDQYETDTTYQLDVSLVIVNETVDPSSLPESISLDIKNVEANTGTEIIDGKYNVTIKYSNGTSIYKPDIDVIRGIEIEPIYVYGTTEIELEEIRKPAGYEDDTNKKIIYLQTDSNGTPYISSIIDSSNNTAARILQKTNIDYTVTNILEVEITRTKIQIPYNLKIVKGLQDIDNVTIPEVTFNVSIDGTVQPTQVTNEDGEILYSDLKGTGRIEILIQETDVPYGYKLDSSIKKVVLNRNANNFEILVIEQDTTIAKENIEINYEDQEVTINIKNPQEFKIEIEKVDSANAIQGLGGAKFDIIPSWDGQNAQTITTDSNGNAEVTFDKVTANRSVIYTIKETEAPQGYRKNKEFKLKIDFNSTGRISNYEILKNGSEVCDWAEIYLPQQLMINPLTGTYGLTDVYKNNSKIKLRITNSNKYNFVLNKVDTANQTLSGVPTDISGAEFDISIKHNGITDVYHKVTLDGLIELENLEGSGEIEIDYEETQPAYGYVQNSTKGKIVFNKDAQTNELTLDTNKTTVDLSKVTVDNETGKVKVEVENESKFQMGIKTVDALYGTALNGARYKVTNDMGDTDTQETAGDGEAIFELGKTYRQKTVTYTIEQEVAPTGYSQVYNLIDNIVIEVYYNEDGKPINYQVTQGEDRVELVEFPGETSRISTNFNDNEINVKITNGEKDEYKIRIIKENENNKDIKISGTEFQLRGINPDGTEQFNETSKTTDSNGKIELQHIDIQDGFKLTVQEITNSDGYCLDTTLREITFNATASTTGEKLIDYTTTDSKVVVQIDNINNIVEVRVPNEPKDIGIAIRKVDKDNNFNLSDAKFNVVDTETNKRYTIITDNSGIGYTSIPLKPDGTYKYNVVEEQAPLGYIKSTGMVLELDFKDNKLEDARVASGGDVLNIDTQTDKYLEMTVKDEEDDGILDEYTVEIVRANEVNLSETIPNAKTKIEVSNSQLATISQESYTNQNGGIFLKDVIKGPGQTTIKITESEAVPGYVWNASDRVVILDRNSATEVLSVKGTSGIARSRISIDTANKIVKIIVGSYKTGVHISTGKAINNPFTVQIVARVKGSTSPVWGSYSTKIYPTTGNVGPNWTTTGYNFLNKYTEGYYRRYYGIYWDYWKGHYYYPYVEYGTVTMSKLYGYGEINIDVTQEAIPEGYVPLDSTQNIKVYRDPTTGTLSLLQEGQNTITTFVQNDNKIVVTIDITPTFTINLEKQDSVDKTQKIDNVEFEVTSNIGQSATVVTGQGGAAKVFMGESVPNSTVIYTIRETKGADGYKQTKDIKLKITFNAAGRISGHTIIEGGDVAEIYFPEQIWYSYGYYSSYSTRKVNTSVYKGTGNIKILVNNDNTFRMEVINEDKDKDGLRIAGSKFTVTLTDSSGNEVIYGGAGGAQTDSNGILYINNIKGEGTLKLHYKQISAGPGYRTDNNLEGDILIYKDPQTYKIKELSHTGPISNIEVEEEAGVLRITLKNERKLEFKVEKAEINNPNTVKLSGAEFELKSQVIMRGSNVVSETEKFEGTFKTKEDGTDIIDLGKAEPQTMVAYTLTETVAPTGYNPIGSIRIVVTFDEKGQVSKVENNTSARAKAYKINLGTIGTRVLNGDINTNAKGENVLGYDFKIEKTDRMISGYPINDTIFNVKVYENGNKVKEEDITTQNNTVMGTIVEKGIAATRNLTAQGTIRVEFTEKQASEGYVLDSTTNVVEFNCTYNQASDYQFTKDLIPTITLNTANTTLPISQIDVNNTERTIIAKVDNEPEVIIGIRNKNIAGSTLIIPQKTYRITSLEEGNTKLELKNYDPEYDADLIDNILNQYATPTSLNVTGLTNTAGETYISVGRPVPGKTVVYLIDELVDGNYENVTKLGIEYDDYGKIKNYYLLVANQKVEIDESVDYTSLSHVNINILEDTEPDPDGFTLNIIKENAHSPHIKLQGVVFKVEVFAEDGTLKNSVIKNTDENGNISLENLSIDGKTEIQISELQTINGYVLDTQTKTITIKPKQDGGIKLLNYSQSLQDLIQVDETSKIVEIRQKNKISGVALAIEKVDADDFGMKINGAVFEVTDEDTHNKYINSTSTSSDIITVDNIEDTGKEEIETVSGVAYLNLPEKDPGVYEYTIKETKAPAGYKSNDKEIKLEVTYNNDKEVDNVVIKKGNDIARVSNQDTNYIELQVQNTQKDLSIGGYQLEIVKVDTNDKSITIPGATFETTIRNQIGVTAPIISTDVTDSDGKITFANINGAGEINIYIDEISAAPNRKINKKVKYARIIRDENTGRMIPDYAQNVDIEVSSKDNKITIYVVNEPFDNLYSLVINKIDNDSNPIKQAGVQFALEIEGNTKFYSTNNNGQIILRDIDMPHSAGTYSYKIQEISAPNGYKKIDDTMELEVTILEDSDGVKKISTANVIQGNNIYVDKINDDYIGINIVNEAGEFAIEKVDKDDSNIKIPGTVFEITEDSTGDKQVLTTDNDGIIDTALKDGTYSIVEKTPTNGYIANSDVIKLQVTSNGSGQKDYQILSGGSNASIDSTTGYKKLVVTNKQEDLSIGAYSLDIVKVDVNDRDIRLKDAKLKINVQNEIGVAGINKTDYTDNNGILSIDQINGAGDITINITELEAPQNRKLDTNVKSVKINRDSTTGKITSPDSTIEIDNLNQKVTVYVGNELVENKYNLVLNKVTTTGEKITQSGIQFEVKEKDSGTSKIYTTDANGKIILTELDMPSTDTITYVIKELQAPDGYELNQEEIELLVQFANVSGERRIINATITQGGENASVEKKEKQHISLNIINNLKDKGKIQIEKVDSEDEKVKIANATFEVLDNTTREIETVTTDRDGIVEIKLPERPEGQYTYQITETVKPNGFVANTQTIDIVVTYKDGEKPKVDILNGQDIAKADDEGEYAKVVVSNVQEDLSIGAYELEVVKVDKDDQDITLPGAKIRIDVDSENGVTGIRKTDVTDTNGLVNIYEINGSGETKIEITELEAPQDRRLDNNTKEIIVNRDSANGEIRKISNDPDLDVIIDNQKIIVYLKNELQEGKYNFIICKTDETNQRIEESGVQFEVTEQSTGISNIYTTNDQGKIIITAIDMPPGAISNYVIKEISAPTGYKLNTEEIHLELEFGDVNGEKGIVNAVITQGNMANVTKQEKQYVSIDIQNEQGSEDLYLRSSVYVIDDNYVDRISPNTTVREFINNCESNGVIKVFDKDGNELQDNDLVGTGMHLTVNGQLYHKLAVIGDLNGDGKISVTDLATAKLALIGTVTLQDEYKMALDVNYDQNQTVTDMTKIKQYIVGMIQF